MIYIRKESIPPVFSKAKRDFSHYDELTKDVKDKLKACLIEEQGGICAYCMGRIEENTSTIEHYIPRNGENGDPSKSLDYHNLLAVCTNGRDDKSRDRQCDVSRENIELHIDPCKDSDMRQIKYKRGGEIFTDTAEFNNDLSVTLNLNNATLKNNRKAALDSALRNMDKPKGGSWSKQFLQKCLDRYNGQNPKTEYVGIIISELEKRLQRTT